MNTYGIEINDARGLRVNTIKLDGWQTAEDAAFAAWELIRLVVDHNPTLYFENQGDQFLALYTEGVTDNDGNSLEGYGAVGFKIINPDGTYYKDL